MKESKSDRTESRLFELFCYHELDSMHWASVAIDETTGQPYTAVYEEVCVGGGRGSKIVEKSPIAYERVYELALRAGQEIGRLWFDPERFRDFNELTWKNYVKSIQDRLNIR